MRRRDQLKTGPSGPGLRFRRSPVGIPVHSIRDKIPGSRGRRLPLREPVPSDGWDGSRPVHAIPSIDSYAGGVSPAAAIYARRSLKQEEDKSVRDQIDTCLTKAVELGYEVGPDDVYSDPDISGWKDKKRPGL